MYPNVFFCANFYKVSTYLFGIFVCLRCTYLFLIIHINFVAYQEFKCIGFIALVKLLDPELCSFKGHLISNIIHYNSGLGVREICLSQRIKPLLSCSVPNLKSLLLLGTFFILPHHHFCFKAST